MAPFYRDTVKSILVYLQIGGFLKPYDPSSIGYSNL
uniref:Uncharacterized protein n=1 Tax=Arundo donax TaxID=35708 RepID=A0A0A8ZA33_ARUDO